VLLAANPGCIIGGMNTSLTPWVSDVERRTRPARVVWCEGSEEESQRLIQEMMKIGQLLELNQSSWPGCYLHRSHHTDVARTEHLTYICTRNEEDAGPTNNWMSPPEAEQKVGALIDGCMEGRTMYVVPYLMGPAGSPLSKVGVQVTDSPYVVANLRIMTRMGRVALDHLGDSQDFAKGLHSLGDLNPDRRFILHFPERSEIWSVGSGYGGNALLSKKCFALRLASWMGRDEGWLAEHMLITGVQDPKGEVTYIAAAFPSACGKTNLAMLVPPASQKGWKVWTVGDDICWMRFGPDGRLWAINPEAGFFGVAPGTNSKTNPNAMATVRKNTIFTNVAMTPDRGPWWEGMDGSPPAGLTDWQGRPWRPGFEKAAHPNSRFTAPARQCPSISPEWENPKGVPISAVIFGGRRAKAVPLVFEAFHWRHGVYVGATMSSETTAAATGAVGVLRRDPFAMLPFCGYNMADYFAHWLKMGAQSAKVPKIFHVNWFRTDAGGRFLWPGYGENLRVLRWMIDRVQGKGEATETPIGLVPSPQALDTDGLNVSDSVLEELLSVDRTAWRSEVEGHRQFFDKFGKRLPEDLRQEKRQLMERLGRVATPAG